MDKIKKGFQYLMNISTFKIFFVIGCFLYTFPITSLIMSRVFKIFLVWAFVIVFYDMWKSKKLGLHKEGYLLLVMLAIAFLGCFWNYKNNLISNITTTMYLFVQMICMLIYDKNKSDEQIIKNINLLSKIVLSITFVCSILSLFIYIFNIKLSIYNGYQEVLIGVFEGRLWSIYGNPNTLGNFSLLSIWFSCILLVIPKYLKTTRIKKIKIIIYINILLQYLCILLSNSRSTILAALVSFAILLLFLMCGRLKSKDETPFEYFRHHSIKMSFYLLVGILSTIVFSIIVKYSIPMITVSIKTVTTSYTSLVNKDDNTSSNNTKPPVSNFKDELEKIQRQDNGKDFSNGRFEIWQGTLKVWKNHPLFGVGFKNVNSNINKYLSEETLKNNPNLSEDTHNIYLEVLVSHGIIAFTLFFLYFVIVMFKYLFYLLKFKQKNIYKYELTLFHFIILISLLIINLFDSNILYFFSIFIVPIFWITNCNIEELILIDEKDESKKNVLFLIDSLAGGGAEKVLIDLTNNLDYSKYNIEVKTIYNEGIYIKQLNKNIEYSSFIKKPNIWKKRIVNRLIKYLPSRVMYDLIITNRYDVEIAFLETLSTKVMTGSNSNANKIAWVHTDIFYKPNNTLLFSNKRNLIKGYLKFNKVVFVSKYAMEKFSKETNIYQNVLTIYNPIIKGDIVKKSKEKCDMIKQKNKILFVSIGRLSQPKAFDRLLKVINKLILKEIKNFEFWIIGEGEDRPKLEEYINKKKLQNYVKLLGFQENPHKYLAKADAYISPSYYEGLSLALVEAMVLGIPVVSTNTPGHVEALDNGNYGLIIDNNEEAIYDGILKILTNKKVILDLKEKVKDRSKFFELEETITNVNKLLDFKNVKQENHKVFCTIFTPAYNRAHLIPRLYESLKKQTNKNFEWVVVDDGSVDGTDKLFEKYLKDKNDFKITYFKQENGGKHRAINKGLELSSGKLFFIVDSDDYLLDSAIEKLYNYENNINDLNGFIGVSGLRGYSNDKAIGSFINKDYIDAYNNERKYYNLLGDKAEAYYTDILKNYKFPEIENERFVSESVVWNKIAADGYKIRWFNEVIYICDYLDDGLTKQGMKLYKNNPIGYLLFVRNVINYENPSIRNRLENYYGYYDAVKDKLSLKEIADNLLISTITLKFTIMVKNIRDKFKRNE